MGIHSQERVTYGTIYFPLGYLIMTIGFWEYSEFFIISLAILAVADPIAAMVGKIYPKIMNLLFGKIKRLYREQLHFIQSHFFNTFTGKVAPPISKQLFVLFRTVLLQLDPQSQKLLVPKALIICQYRL